MCYLTSRNKCLILGINRWMKKIFFCILASAVALTVNGCAPVQVAPSVSVEMRPDVYQISARSTSRKVLAETVKSAKERCEQENKQYLFVKNIFQLGSYDLYFTCVEAGDPRLNERKVRPGEEKIDPGELKRLPAKDRGQGIVEDRPGPEKEKPPVPAPATPVKEPVTEKPPVSSDKEAAPAQEKKLPVSKDESQGKQDAAPKGPEDQLRKKNPGPGEPESLKNDEPPLDGKTEQDIPVIEEPLVGEEAMDKANYLKRRLRKKK